VDKLRYSGTRGLITENTDCSKTKTKNLYEGDETNCVGPEQIKMGSYQCRKERKRIRYMCVAKYPHSRCLECQTSAKHFYFSYRKYSLLNFDFSNGHIIYFLMDDVNE
jgi:hypothetical protein